MFLLGYNPRDEHSRREIARGERFYPHSIDLQNMQACYVSEWSALEGMRPTRHTKLTSASRQTRSHLSAGGGGRVLLIFVLPTRWT